MKDESVIIVEETSYWTAHYATFRWQSRFKSTSKKSEWSHLFFQNRPTGRRRQVQSTRPDLRHPSRLGSTYWSRLPGLHVSQPIAIFTHTGGFFLASLYSSFRGFQMIGFCFTDSINALDKRMVRAVIRYKKRHIHWNICRPRLYYLLHWHVSMPASQWHCNVIFFYCYICYVDLLIDLIAKAIERFSNEGPTFWYWM